MALTESDDERRLFTRIFFDAESVLAQGDKAWSVQLIDISLHGLLVETAEAAEIDKTALCTVSIHLGGDVQIQMQGNIVRQRGNRLGMNCAGVELESLMHLRRLVELNQGDSKLLERELKALY
ncbi:MAG: PilZ domain-containing protein [Pseudomonadales bacterium]|nr:PilZ domain-containing protein [Pseudomonadales bacterium]